MSIPRLTKQDLKDVNWYTWVFLITFVFMSYFYLSSGNYLAGVFCVSMIPLVFILEVHGNRNIREVMRLYAKIECEKNLIFNEVIMILTEEQEKELLKRLKERRESDKK